MVATASHGGAVWWMFTRWKVGMVTLQGKSCVIHTWALMGWGSHEEVLYKCSAFTFTFLLWRLVHCRKPGAVLLPKSGRVAGSSEHWWCWGSCQCASSIHTSRWVVVADTGLIILLYYTAVMYFSPLCLSCTPCTIIYIINICQCLVCKVID